MVIYLWRRTNKSGFPGFEDGGEVAGDGSSLQLRRCMVMPYSR